MSVLRSRGGKEGRGRELNESIQKKRDKELEERGNREGGRRYESERKEKTLGGMRRRGSPL